MIGSAKSKDVNKMNRRQVLKILSATGVGALAAGIGLFETAEASPTLFFVTNDVRGDLMRLSRIFGVRAFNRSTVATTAIQPAAQDLSLIADGRLIDPSVDVDIPAPLRQFAFDIRKRTTPGQYLVSVSPKSPEPKNKVVIELDGKVFDELPLDAEYRRIEVPGAMGTTVLALNGGQVAVTHASCKHGLCKKVGAQSTGHIVCAPNRLVVRMPSAPTLLDAISG